MDSCAISPEFAPLPPLTFPRGKHAAVALQKSIYLMGGMDSGYRREALRFGGETELQAMKQTSVGWVTAGIH